MSVFDVMRDTIRADPNVSVDIVYHQRSGGVIPCRANFTQPDITAQLQTARTKDRKRYLSVSQSDVPNAASGDTVEIPAGGPTHNVIDVDCDDPLRIDWKLTVAPQ